MSQQSPLDPLASTQQATVEASFAVLELCLQELARLAPVDNAEVLLKLIPPLPAASRQLILVELIKVDMGASLQRQKLHGQTLHGQTLHGQTLHGSGTQPAASGDSLPRPLEFYWPAVGGILPIDNIPIDLLLEELHLRRRLGQSPSWEDYQRRFPQLAQTLQLWLAAGDTHAARTRSTRQLQEVPELPLGGVVDDFQIISLLGQGAFARVYLARQISMQRLVALKVSNFGSEEPQALSQLDHPNIVRVYDQRHIDQPAASLLYMQYLPGGSLADIIRQQAHREPQVWSGQLIVESINGHLLAANQTVPEHSPLRDQLGRMPWAEAVAWIGVQLAEGLGYAAEKGVLHRDVKPANILLGAEAVPKLVDFNVSCSGLSGRAGAAAYFGGSLAYMSPEQLQVADPTDPLRADQLDGRSDLYALGMVLWELWQGQRPWTLMDLASNWTAAVSLQRRLRSQAFAPRVFGGSPTERMLEQVLRSLLAVDPVQRPQTGHEAAARLRLALHPELATRLAPAPDSFSGWLLRMPVLLLCAVLIFGPNTAASIFNYDYNFRRMAQIQSVPDILSDFRLISNWVNGIVYPLGLILFLLVVLPIARIVERGRQGIAASQAEISQLWNIGNRVTLICGILWAVSGVVFAVTFASMHAEFGFGRALHFFLSLVLCGGVAWIYPYFGLTLLAVLVYYPLVLAPSMRDPGIAIRCRQLRRCSRWYLASAAAIPLTAVGALVFRDDLPKNLILAGVCLTAVGLAAAFMAFQKLEDSLRQMQRVLGPAETPDQL